MRVNLWASISGLASVLNAGNTADNKLRLVGDDVGLYVSQTSLTTTVNGIELTRDGGNESIQLLRLRTDASGSNYFSRNLAAAATAGAVLKVHNASAGDDQFAFHVVNAGAGDSVHIRPTGSGIGLGMINVGSGHSIITTNGTSDVFRLTKNGELRIAGDDGGETGFNSVTGTSAAATSIGGTTKVIKVYVGTTAYYLLAGTTYA